MGLVPVIDGSTLSVAVTVNVPDFFGDTLQQPLGKSSADVPSVSVTGFPELYTRFGSSVEESTTDPLYPVATLPWPSSAVIVSVS
jgi:hypothetical protein